MRISDWSSAVCASDLRLGFAVADMMYVRHRPEHFRLLQFAVTEVVWGAAPASRRQSCVEAHAPLRQATLDVIDEAIAAGDLDPRGLPAAEICLAPWALALGLHQIGHTQSLVGHTQVADP